MKHLRYLRYILRHKWFVFVAGSKLGIPFLAAMHDNSKFRPSEWFPYANFFYGPKVVQVRDETGYYKPTDTGDATFDFAWFLHQQRNKHHWQHWLRVKRRLACCIGHPVYGDARIPLGAPAPEEYVSPWEIGLLPEDEGGFKCVQCGRRLTVYTYESTADKMPSRYRREMLADWIGAGKAQGTPGTLGWYTANHHKMRLHPDTRAWIEGQIGFSAAPVSVPAAEVN